MKINIDTAVDQVDVPAMKSRIPRERQDDVLERILNAVYHYPSNRSSWKRLDRNLAGYYKVVFSSGLNDAQDMRIALSYDETTDTVTVMAVGFRDAHIRPDFYQRLQVRIDTNALRKLKLRQSRPPGPPKT